MGLPLKRRFAHANGRIDNLSNTKSFAIIRTF
jgi:hypothetical protein